jgi:tRNA-dihydrouridine synthase A
MFHRRFTRRALLYTEMTTTGAILRGPRERLLAFDPEERPLALQIGGSEPAETGQAAAVARALGFDEVNLNVGCPSDRVQAGCFGAALMREPGRVADCAAAMIAAAGPLEVTVKCRIGVDEQDPEAALPALLEAVAAAGVRRVAIHARKAWLAGLSSKANREIPPLDYAIVRRMRAAFPGLAIVLNGGVPDLAAAEAHLASGLEGVMIGRVAYQAPAMLGAVDRAIFGAAGPDVAPEAAVRAMLPYVERERLRGVSLQAIARHMLGAFAGRPGARTWRRILSEEAHRPGAGPETLERALRAVAPAGPARSPTEPAAA